MRPGGETSAHGIAGKGTRDEMPIDQNLIIAEADELMAEGANSLQDWHRYRQVMPIIREPRRIVRQMRQDVIAHSKLAFPFEDIPTFRRARRWVIEEAMDYRERRQKEHHYAAHSGNR